MVTQFYATKYVWLKLANTQYLVDSPDLVRGLESSQFNLRIFKQLRLFRYSTPNCLQELTVQDMLGIGSKPTSAYLVRKQDM